MSRARMFGEGVSTRPSGRDIFKRLRARGLGDLAKSIARTHGCMPHEMLGRRRLGHFIAARRALYVELRGRGWSFPAIGALVDRDHSSVQCVLFDDERKATVKARRARRVEEGHVEDHR